MNKNRIEMIINVVPVGVQFQVQGLVTYIHNTVIQKTVDIKSDLYDTQAEADKQKKQISKIIKESLVKVKEKIPNAKLFKHEFNKES